MLGAVPHLCIDKPFSMRKHVERMRVFAGEPTCKKFGQQEETAEHFQFDCESLGQVGFTMCGLVSFDWLYLKVL